MEAARRLDQTYERIRLLGQRFDIDVHDGTLLARERPSSDRQPAADLPAAVATSPSESEDRRKGPSLPATPVSVSDGSTRDKPTALAVLDEADAAAARRMLQVRVALHLLRTFTKQVSCKTNRYSRGSFRLPQARVCLSGARRQPADTVRGRMTRQLCRTAESAEGATMRNLEIKTKRDLGPKGTARDDRERTKGQAMQTECSLRCRNLVFQTTRDSPISPKIGQSK